MRKSVPRLLASISLLCTVGCGGGATTTNVTPASTGGGTPPSAAPPGAADAGGTSGAGAPGPGMSGGGASGGDASSGGVDAGTPARGALRWTVEDSGASLLTAIWGSGADDVWVVGPRVVLHSRGDGHWTRVYQGSEADSFAAVFGAGGAVFVAGSDCDAGVCSDGVILRSRDGGATWTRQVVANAGFGFSADGGAVYLAANDVYVTRDGFDTFERLQASFPTAVGVHAGAGALIAFGGQRGGIISRSSDGGHSWQTVFQGVAGSKGGHIDQVAAAGATLYGLGNACSVPACFAALVRSDDGGQGWRVTNDHVMDYARGLWAAAPDDLYVAGTTLAHSRDGATFTPVALPLDTQWAGVWGSSADDVYVIGTDGAIVHGRRTPVG